MDAVEVTEYGTADVLTPTEREKPEPGPGHVRIEVEAAGINFADILQRRGVYAGGPEPPYVPGFEVAGRIDAVGEGVDRNVGEPVVAQSRTGYAEFAIANEAALFDIPGDLSFVEAAGFPVQFITAHNVLFEWGGLDADETVLVTAAAGGVGSAAVQLARNAGAEIVATASSAEKLAHADRLGADHTINYEKRDVAEAVEEATGGDGVDLVLDGVGGDTHYAAYDVLNPFGRVVVYGVASGEVAHPDTRTLLYNNYSLLGYHLGRTLQREPERALAAVPKLDDLLATGRIEVIVGETFPLAEAAEAHRFIERRESRGKVVLVP